jgi:hypothetical protein
LFDADEDDESSSSVPDADDGVVDETPFPVEFWL